MHTTTFKCHSLGYTQAKTYFIVTAFVMGNILLPQLVHTIPQGGFIFLPIYFFTLIAAYKYGWKAGLLTAILSPIINYLAFNMPPPGRHFLNSCEIRILSFNGSFDCQ